MNANKLFLAPLCMLCLFIQSVWGEGLKSWIDDPLMAQPIQLQAGVTLPDTSQVNCVMAADFSQPLELHDAVDTALCNNPQIRATWAQIKVQTGVLGEARAAYLPTINGSVSRLRNTTTYGSQQPSMTNTGNQYYGTLNWRLFDFGGREANREAASQMLLAAIAGHDASLQKTMNSVIQAWFEAITSQATMVAREQISTLAQQTLNVAQRREQKGVSSHDDTLQASTALAKAELNEMHARGNYLKNLALLKQTMAVDMNTPVILPQQPERVIPADIRSLNQWLKEAESHHPAIKQARAKWRADQDKITVVRSEGLPTADLTAHISENGFPNQGLSNLNQTSRDIGITVSIPLFEGFSRKYKIMEARAQAEQSEAQMEDTTAQILTEVVKAYADAKTAVGMLAASDRLLSAAQASLISAKRRYANNVADILEVLNSQSSLADAQQQHIEAISQWRSARLSLLANTGILSQLSGADEML